MSEYKKWKAEQNCVSCSRDISCYDCLYESMQEKIQQLEKEVERLKIELLKAREYEFMYKECSK